MNLGKGKDLHRAMQQGARVKFQFAGYNFIAIELKGADVLAYDGPGYLPECVAGEVERSKKNVLRNIYRDFENGCTFVLDIAPTERLKSSIQRLLENKLAPELRERVMVCTLDEFLTTPLQQIINKEREGQ